MFSLLINFYITKINPATQPQHYQLTYGNNYYNNSYRCNNTGINYNSCNFPALLHFVRYFFPNIQRFMLTLIISTPKIYLIIFFYSSIKSIVQFACCNFVSVSRISLDNLSSCFCCAGTLIVLKTFISVVE